MGSDYDVIVAGAGPAGSTAARVLSGAGLSVLVIDRAEFPRRKLCAGLLTLKTMRLIERLFGEGPKELSDRGIVNYTAGGFEIYCKENLLMRRSIPEPFRMVDRESFDNHLLELARGAGAAFRGGDAVRSVDILKKTVTTESGASFSSDFLIGADGVNSRVRRTVPVELYGRSDWKAGLAAAHEIIIDKDAAAKRFDWPALYFGYTKSGYGWAFPTRDRLKAGFAASFEMGKKEILSEFRRLLDIIGIEETARRSAESYVLPYGNYLPVPCYRHILLAGDAAGFADPLMGEGIYYAMKSGSLAAEAIIKGRKGDTGVAASIYRESIDKYIMPEMIYAARIRKLVFGFLFKMKCIPLKIVMGIFGDLPAETIQGLRSYRWMKRNRDIG